MRNYEESPKKHEEFPKREEADVVEFRRPSRMGLLSDDEIVDTRQRWNEIQARFIDSPREAVEEADKLVTSCVEGIAKRFKDQRSNLASQWGSKDVTTEDLRLTLQHYRRTIDHLLSM